MTRPTPTEPVERIVARSPVYVRPEATLLEVAETLDREDIGVVAVRGAEGIAGILSERDIVRAVAESSDVGHDRAADVMTYDVEAVPPTESIRSVAARMLRDEIRHLPVRDGEVTIGVVSIRDVLRVFVESSDDSR